MILQIYFYLVTKQVERSDKTKFECVGPDHCHGDWVDIAANCACQALFPGANAAACVMSVREGLTDQWAVRQTDKIMVGAS